MRFDFAADVAGFDLEQDSRRNADYAYQLIYAVLFDARCAVFRQGMRAAAHRLDQRPRTKDQGPSKPSEQAVEPEVLSFSVVGPPSSVGLPSSSAVYTAHGERGCMAPNQYWVPGCSARCR